MPTNDALTEFERRCERGEYLDAVRHLRAAAFAAGGTRLVPENREVLVAGIALSAENVHDIVTADSEAVGVHELAGLVWAADGAELTALEIMAVAVDEGSAPAIGAYGEMLHWLGSDTGALPWLVRAVEDDSTDTPWLRGLLGEACVVLGYVAEAIEHLEIAAPMYPEFGIPLSKALRNSGRIAEARDILVPLVDAGEYGAAIALGNLLQDHEDDDDGAERAYLAGIESGDAHSAFNLGLLYDAQDRVDEARAAFARARAGGDLWRSPYELQEERDRDSGDEGVT